jgi:hypothetical protein
MQRARLLAETDAKPFGNLSYWASKLSLTCTSLPIGPPQILWVLIAGKYQFIIFGAARKHSG